MLASLHAVRMPGIYVYCSLPRGTEPGGVAVAASIVEPEGMSIVVQEQEAVARGWQVLLRAAWIQFGLVSALDAVGLTAAVSAALAAAGISCNMVAGAYHDHVFVPVERASEALELLNRLRINLPHNE